MSGLASIIEDAIRHPGFAFVNVQSPCVTFGRPEAQLKEHKTQLQDLAELGHDPNDWGRALELAREYGSKLYGGIFYRDGAPASTFEQAAAARRRELAGSAPPREKILDLLAHEEL